MTPTLVVLGPPGTGKTTRLARLYAQELERGTPPGRVATVAFTRAAALELRRRLWEAHGLSKAALRHVGTIHSQAYRLLGMRRAGVFGGSCWRAFADRHHYELTALSGAAAGDAAEPPRRTRDDELRFVLEWGQSRRLDPEAALRRCPLVVNAPAFRQFARRVAEFKRVSGLVGFSDMLERVLELGLRPDVDVAFIDEAQDLSPLQVAGVEAWFASCERVYVAGDDDQAVYEFQAADPEWLLRLAEQSPIEELTQSHRVPVVVHMLAESIVCRNRRRVPKVYRPTDVLGRVEFLDLDEAVSRVTGEVTTFVLARNRMFLRPVAGALVERAVPFYVVGAGGRSPLSDPRLREAFRAASELASPEVESVRASSLSALLQFVAANTALAPRRVKERVRSAARVGEHFTWGELREDLELGPLLDAIDRDGAVSVFGRIAEPDRRYLRALIARYDEVPEPRVELNSIHGAKGKEAELVVVLSDMTRATYEEYVNRGTAGYEAENRVFYVAATRTQRTLIIVRPRTRRSFLFPRVPYLEGLA